MKNWNDEKGFGFIEPSDGGEDVFVHRTNIGGLQALTEGGGSLDLVKGMTEAEVTNTLTAELQAADSSGSGILSLKQVQGVLAASSLGLTSQEVQALVSACDMAENGVDYMSLASFGFYILQYLAGQA